MNHTTNQQFQTQNNNHLILKHIKPNYSSFQYQNTRLSQHSTQSNHTLMSFRASPIKGLDPYPSYDALAYSPVTPIVRPFQPDETQRLNQLLYEKNLELSKLYEEINTMRRSYEEQIVTYQKTIQALQRQVSEKDMVRDLEFEKIKQKFQKLTAEQSESLRSVHSHQIDFLLKEIAQQRATNESLNLKLTLQSQQSQRVNQSYERQISSNVAEINSLNKLISKLQDDKNKEIRELNSKRQLQKSRTSGLISSRRQNSTFMDRQVRKLNEEIMEKTLKIQGVERELVREKRKYQDTVRQHNTLVNEIKEKYEEQLQIERQQYSRTEKALKLEIKELKQQALGYIQQIDELKTRVTIKEKQVLSITQTLQSKKQQIDGLKTSIQKLREQHANEINNLMKDRRKSRSNIGSSRSIISLKESGMISDNNHESGQMHRIQRSYSGSMKLDKNLHPIKQQSPDRAEQKDYSRELADSHLQYDEPIESEIQRAVYHYDNLIEELKKNHGQELELLKLNEKKLRNRLQQKEHELLDILTKFSPLVKIHAGEKSIQEDRKQRIERHWKADVALLDVLLRKYKIKVFQ